MTIPRAVPLVKLHGAVLMLQTIRKARACRLCGRTIQPREQAWAPLVENFARHVIRSDRWCGDHFTYGQVIP